MDSFPLFLAGAWDDGEGTLDVHSPWDGSVVARTARAGPRELELAAEAALTAFEQSRRSPAWQKSELLERVARLLEEQAETFARALVGEAGKPIRLARAEVARGVHTLKCAAALSLRGELLPLDTAPWGAGCMGFYRRVPAGPVAAIAPFNFPLNLALHKIAPAVAAGNTVVLKPASRTPLTALMAAELFAEAGAPPGLLSVLPCGREAGDRLVADPRFRVLTFTGSPEAGWAMRARAGRKRVVLELGGNAAAVVHEDADLELAVERICTGAFGFSGQSCISVQRVLAHESILDELLERLAAAAGALVTGDPGREETDLGPLIDSNAAERVIGLVDRARAAGARVLCGGTRAGAVVAATVLTGVAPDSDLERRELFGPVVSVSGYREFEDALRRVDDSVYGLQAGLFTRDLERVFRAWEGLEVGGLMVNEVPTFRVDSMPYGGVKESGMGREGPEWALEHMTERRLLVVRRKAP